MKTIPMDPTYDAVSSDNTDYLSDSDDTVTSYRAEDTPSPKGVLAKQPTVDTNSTDPSLADIPPTGLTYTGKMYLDLPNDIFTVHDLDGRMFPTPLLVTVGSAVMRQMMKTAPDPDAALQAIIERITTLAADIDPATSEIVLTDDGVQVRTRADAPI